MKRSTVTNIVSANNVTGRQEFRVDSNAEMFQLIISNLYSRPMEAIIRELSCNAHDSHVAAGNADKPFDIKLPNNLDQTFHIRDYGTGLTPDEIYNLYTVVGLSNKTNSDDFTGSFGVGSKSPFAYTSQFSVESIVDGKKWIYAAFMNEANIPEIADMSNGGFETTEPNGVKITFDILRNDWRDWYRATAKALYAFKLKPNILGYAKEEILAVVAPTYEVEGASIRMFGHNFIPNHVNYAIMGNVAYEVDMSAIPNVFPITGCDLHFEIGALTPAASREYLQYDEKTINNIRNKVQTIVDQYKKDFALQFNDCKTLWQARLKFNHNRWEEQARAVMGSNARQFVNNFGKTFELKGKTYDLTETKINNDVLFADVKDRDFNIYTYETQYRSVAKSRRKLYAANSTYGSIPVVALTYYASDRTEYVFVFCDTKYARFSKCKLLAENSDKTLIVFDTSDYKSILKKLKAFGVPDSNILYVSKLEKPERQAKAATKATTLAAQRKEFVKVFSQSSYGTNSIWSDNRYSQLDEEVYNKFALYVIRDRFNWGYPGAGEASSHLDVNSLYALWSTITRLPGMPAIKIYSVPKTKMELIPDAWQALDTFVTDLYTWLLGSDSSTLNLIQDWAKIGPKADQTYFSSLACCTTDSINNIEDVELRDWLKKVKGFSQIIASSRELEKLKTYAEQINPPNTAAQLSTESQEFSAFLSTFKEKYGILSLLGSIVNNCRSGEPKIADSIIQYINLINKQENN